MSEATDHYNGLVATAGIDMTEGALAPVRRIRLVEEVTRQLRDMIIDGRLPAGTQLRQIELSEQLGVSRTPLREAFRILENDGLVRVSNANRTVEVVTITSADLREMYEIREVVDGLAARLAAQKGLAAEVEDELRALIAEMRAAAHPYDPGRRTAAHIRFHSLIAESTDNPQLATFLPLIRVSSAALYLPFIRDPSAAKLVTDGRLVTHAETLERAQRHHEAIVDAIAAGDSRKAEAAARRHIAQTLRAVPQLDEWRRVIAEAGGGRTG
jgi:GntR family transcriptional regulator of vanillate catabolism